MAKIDKKVSTLIPYQFPLFYREDRPELVEFVKKYYEFLESSKLYFSNKKYNEFYLLSEDNERLIQENATAKGEVSTFTLESNRNNTLLNIEIDHFEKGEIIVGEVSKAQFLVTARERIVKITDKTHLMPDGTIMKNSDHDLDVVYGHFLSDAFFIKGEKLIGQTTRLESVYENIERNPLAISRDIENLFDIDYTIDEFINKFYKELLPYVPKNIDYDKEYVLKRIKDLYTSKGNEDSFRFLFKLIYPNSNLDFYYPKQDMLRVSDGKWVVETVIRIGLKNAINPFLLEGRRIVGQSSNATAFVNASRVINSGFFGSLELVITNINGEFKTGELVLSYDEETETNAGGKLESVLSQVNVISGGKNYSIGEKLVISGGGGIGAEAVIKTLNDGVIDSLDVYDPGDGYIVGDYIEFNNSGTSGDGASGIVSEIIPLIDFKIIDQKIEDIKFATINAIDYGGTFSGHNANTHLLSEPTTTIKVTFNPEVSSILFKQGDWIEVDGSSNTISGVIVNGDGSSSSITGANSVLIAIRSGVYSNEFNNGDVLISYDIRTGRTSDEIDNAIDLVSTGASGTIYSVEEVGENPLPFGSLSGTDDLSGSQYFGALTYTTKELGGILKLDVLEGGTLYELAPTVSVTNELIAAYANDIDSLGNLTRILKFNSNSAINFNYGNYVRGSVHLSITGSGDEFNSLEYIRGESSDAIGIYVKSLGPSSDYNLYSSDDTFLVTHIPTSFLSLANNTLTGSFIYGETIKGESSGAEAIYLYHVGDTGIIGESPGNTEDEIRIITKSGNFFIDELVYGIESGAEANTSSISHLSSPVYIEFTSGETLKGLESSVERSVVTAPISGDPVFFDAPEGKIVGPITDTFNNTYSELRIYPDLSKPEFSEEHYIVEYSNNYTPFSNSPKGQLRDTNAVQIDDRIKGYLHTRIYVDNLTAGSIKTVEVTKFGQGFNAAPNVTGPNTGEGAILEAVIESVATYPGKYIGTQGLLDSLPKIQDSYYYQSFSYVLKTDVDIAGSLAFQNVIKKILHPAGLAVFGEIFIISNLDLTISTDLLVQAQIFTTINNEVIVDPEHEIEIYSGFYPYSVNARIRNEYDEERILLEDWEYIDNEIQLRAFGEKIYIAKEDDGLLLNDLGKRDYLLVKPMFPDMAPIVENVSIILEDGNRNRVDDNIWEREIDYLLLEDSTDIYKIRLVTEFEYSDNDITIDLGPEWFEDFDWGTEVEINLYQNVEIITDTEHEIQLDLYENVEVIPDSEHEIEIHQNKFGDVDANFNLTVEENHEIQFGIFHGHIPMSDGPIFYWENALIGGQLSDEIVAKIEYEDYDYYTLVYESNDWFYDGQKIVTENYETGYFVSEYSGNIVYEDNSKIITEVSIEVDYNDNFIEEKPSSLQKLVNENYYIITEPDHNEESFIICTDSLFSFVYEDVQIFTGLQVYKGRKTADEYQNILEEDWIKNSRINRLRSIQPYGYVLDTALEKINIFTFREIEFLKNVNIELSEIRQDIYELRTIILEANTVLQSFYYEPNSTGLSFEKDIESSVSLISVKSTENFILSPQFLVTNVEIKNALLDYSDPNEVFPEKEQIPVIEIYLNGEIPIRSTELYYEKDNIESSVSLISVKSTENFILSPQFLVTNVEIKNALLDYSDPNEVFPEKEQIPVIEIYLNGEIPIRSSHSEIDIILNDFYANFEIGHLNYLEIDKFLEKKDTFVNIYNQIPNKEYDKSGSSLSDGQILPFLSNPIEFYLPLKIPTGLSLFGGDVSEPIDDQIELFLNNTITGTATIINNSKTVIGINTLFTEELSIGDYLVTKQTLNSKAQKFIVTNIINDTLLEINIEFTGSYNSEELLKEVAI